jgi:hypothetical protein
VPTQPDHRSPDERMEALRRGLGIRKDERALMSAVRMLVACSESDTKREEGR